MRSFSIRLAVAALFGACMAAGPASEAFAENVLKFARAQAIDWNGRAVNVSLVIDFYKRQAFQGVWTARQGLTPRGEELVAMLADAGSDGLDPGDYIGGLDAGIRKMTGDNLAALELALSEAAVKYATHLHGGRTTPSIEDPDIVIPRKKLDIVALLGSMAKNGPAAVAARLRPQHTQYAALRAMLPGAKDEAMRRRIVVNMERWRWLPRDLGDRHVLVNIAAFTMYTRDGGRTVDTRKVIVGSQYHKTPMFSENIKRAEYNPTWTVTPSIAGNEILPKLRHDPGYLEKRGYLLYTSWEDGAPAMSAHQIDWESVSPKRFPYRIVQPAGPENALGLVKFLFPNKFNVYLHDTASRDLFAKVDRALSHGCIRVHRPLEFAELLHRLDGSLSRPQIDGVVATKQTTPVNFRTPIPIHLTYFTLWPGDDGKVASHPDVYGRDKKIAAILFGGA